MLKKLRLQRFKNFKDAELILGPLPLLVGKNASDKSNIGDAFRFLHGISRNYNLAEIFGEKWIESGALQWRGIRSGTREITFQGAETFVLEVSFSLGEDRDQEAIYRIEVAPGNNDTPPKLIAESLAVEGQKTSIFEATLVDKKGQNDLSVRVQGTLINDPIRVHPSLVSLKLRTAHSDRHNDGEALEGRFLLSIVHLTT